MGVISRVKDAISHGFNLFRDSDPTSWNQSSSSGAYSSHGLYGSPNRRRSPFMHERSIISSIHTRIGIDVAAIELKHVRLDDEKRYLKDETSSLQDCLTVDPNLDQGPRQFRQDAAMTILEHGVIAIVVVDSDINPEDSSGFDIKELRVGEIVGWDPGHVRVNLYDQRKGERREVRVAKRHTAVVENPLYTVMNEPNSTLQRLLHKINLLDTVDDATSSGKLDMIIQLPYVIKTDARRQQAEQRRQDIEFQLKGSKYGIAYTDGTEKITQLNRPVENDLLRQIEYLTAQLYAQLGLTVEVMNGTADEAAMLNYYSRTVEPIIQAIAEAMNKAFLTKTARTQKQSIMYFRDPFKLVPMSMIADIADKMARNEILTSNDLRQAIGYKPSSDPKANQLINSNMPAPADAVPTAKKEIGGDSQNGT